MSDKGKVVRKLTDEEREILEPEIQAVVQNRQRAQEFAQRAQEHNATVMRLSKFIAGENVIDWDGGVIREKPPEPKKKGAKNGDT